MPMNNNVFGNHDHLGLIGSANEELLCQSGNKAYMQLVMENLRLKNQILGAQSWQQNVDDTNLHGKIDQQNINPHQGYSQAFVSNTSHPAAQVLLFRRAAFLQATFPLAHKEPNIMLKQEDYPAVRYWIPESFTLWFSKQPVIKKRLARGEISIKDYFLEDKHGKLISSSTISSIRRYLKTTFTKIQQHMPELLGSTSSELDQEFLKLLCHELRVMYPELALCSQDWKALVILSRWYSYWKSGHLGNYTCEDEYFESENDEESASNSHTSASNIGKVPANSVTDALSATKHDLSEGSVSATLKRQKITDVVENPPQSVPGTAGVKYENQEDKISVASLSASSGTFPSSSTSQRASVKTKESGHRRQKVTSSIYPRNLCAKEWKKLHPNGTTREFREHWESIGVIGRLRWSNLSKDLKKEQTATVSGQGGA
ncbi:hypothetical protein APHAL10511_003533 [Amanita phalloides]|nr:hypothetical protein APHAL10511_003533 [Amanita phalloides]